MSTGLVIAAALALAGGCGLVLKSGLASGWAWVEASRCSGERHGQP
jgi:hypothetical protein